MNDLLPVLLAGEPGWTPSNYMPDVKVEIAFNAGYNTPTADRVWTDVSEWVELDRRIGITVGRQDELGQADANRLNLTLDNSDGRFTAGRSASPYYPNVKIGRPIRVSAMTVTGHTSVRFVGFVDQWPTAWDGTDAYAYAQLTASSRLARLGLSHKLRTMVESEVLATRPHRYYTVGEATGSETAADSSGNGGVPIPKTATDAAALAAGHSLMSFGTGVGPDTDDLPAAEFTAADGVGVYLASTNGTNLSASPGPRTLAGWVRITGLPAVLSSSSLMVCSGMNLAVTAAGLLAGVSTVGPSINDGVGHHVALVRDGTDEILYLDGVAVDSAPAGLLPFTSNTIVIGAFNGTAAHVAMWEAALTPAQIASQAEVLLSGAVGERTDERVERVLRWASVAETDVLADVGVETMTYQKPGGNSVVDALRVVESTESGILYDRPDGLIGFRNRNHRYAATVAVTLDMEAQHVGGDYAPKLDRSTLQNDVTVDNPTTGESARYVDATSRDEYGVATGGASIAPDTADPLFQKAAWLVGSYAEPRPRVPSLTVDILAHVNASAGPTAEDLLDLTVSSRITVINQPAQVEASDADYFAEGYTETIGPESYSITFNLSPAHPSLSVFIVDDATRGRLDEGNILGL